MFTRTPLRQLAQGVPKARKHLSSASKTVSSGDSEIPVASIQPRAGSPIDVLVVGAGNINFGSEEGPWNHSQRLELKLGSRLNVVGLVDPVAERAQAVLQAKNLTMAAPAYAHTKVYKSIADATKALAQKPPALVLLGSPPAFRGRLTPGIDAEKQLVDAFPESGLFVEKPVSTGTVEDASDVAKMLKDKRNVSVGYMLRYSKAVQKMKEIIKENELTVMMTSARYVMAYEFSKKLAWWDKAIDCGPIVEQATHFCDLSRYFGGEVRLPSVLAHSLEWHETPGQLSKMNIDETLIEEDNRIPRFTSATWKYENGALGHLEHGVALQGTEFSTEFTVFADGYQLKLIDPYNNPALYVRRPASDTQEVLTFRDDDPFLAEISSFIDTYELGKSDIPILSSYDDAVRTYEMTWAIRRASESTQAPQIQKA